MTWQGCCLPRPFGEVSMSLAQRPGLADSTMTKDDFLAGVAATKEHIKAGDVFQLVLSHRQGL